MLIPIQAVFLRKVIAVALKHKLITFEYGKQAEASDNLIEQIIPLLDEPINVVEEGYTLPTLELL